MKLKRNFRRKPAFPEMVTRMQMILPVFINDDEHYSYKEMEKSLMSYPSKMLKQRTLGYHLPN